MMVNKLTLIFVVLCAVAVFNGVNSEPAGSRKSISRTTRSAGGYVRGCYFTNWAQWRQGDGKFTPADIENGLCNHILYAFAHVNNDFTIKILEHNDVEMYKMINDLKKEDPELKTSISIGGWGAPNFSPMAGSAANRKTFIDAAIAFVRQYDFDGVDIDWEYPQGYDKDNYSALLREMKAAFAAEASSSGKERLSISAAVSVSVGAGYDVPVMNECLDQLYLMSYDYAGGWSPGTAINSPLYPDMANSAKSWADSGMAKSKIIIGVASYGRGFTLTSSNNNGLGAPFTAISNPLQYTATGGFGAYYELCGMVDNGAQVTWVEDQKVPYLVQGNQWFGYDNIKSTQEKVNFVKSEQYGGAFVWTLDFDDFHGNCKDSDGPYPLIRQFKLLDGDSPPVDTTTASATEATTPVTKPTDAPEPSTSKPDPETTPEPATTTDGPAPPPTTQGGAFACPSDGLFADPNDPGKYYNCAGGIATQMECPGGLVFNEAISACDWP